MSTPTMSSGVRKTDRIRLTGYYNPGSDTNWAFNGDNIYNLNTGNVGVGKSSGINYNFDVCGNINCTSPYYTISGEVFNNSFLPALPYDNSIKSVGLSSTQSLPFRSSGLEQPSYNDIAWSPELGLFCAVSQAGLQGRIATSPDGITWTPRNNNGIFLSNVTNLTTLPNCFNDGSGNSVICASTADLFPGNIVSTTTVASITDISRFVTNARLTITPNSSLPTQRYTCLDTSGLLVNMTVSSYSGSGTFSGRQCLSVDSSRNFQLSSNRNWVNNLCFAENGYNGVVWCRDLSGQGMFVACNNAGGLTGTYIATSANGITWTNRTTPSGITSCVGAAYSPKLKRVVVTTGSGGLTSILYSDDGINWNSVTTPVSTNNYGNSIVWSPELEIFACYSQANTGTLNVITSPDGINWTGRTAPPSSNPSLAWSPELGVFCATNPNSFVVLSPDGVNWTRYNVSNITLPQRKLAWCPQLRMFIGGNGDKLSYSFNGINWFNRTLVSSAPGTNNLGMKCVNYSPELGIFVISGSSNLSNGTAVSTDPIFTGNFKTRPPTSYNVFDSSYNNINEFGLWTIPRFGRGIPVIRTDISFSVTPGMNWIICNRSDVSSEVHLPSASAWPGQELMIKTVQNRGVISPINNILPLNIGTDLSASNVILSGTAGKWATLVSNGTNWVIMRAN